MRYPEASAICLLWPWGNETRARPGLQSHPTMLVNWTRE